jgi:hypothetical protein
VHVSVSCGTRDDLCIGSSSSDPIKLDPMDKFVCSIDGKSSKEEALRQLSMNEALFKERLHQASQYVARWVYTHGKNKISPICLYVDCCNSICLTHN